MRKVKIKREGNGSFLVEGKESYPELKGKKLVILTKGEFFETLDSAVSMVVKDNQGQISYWALAHYGPRPDFHGRESFLIDL